MSRVSSIRDRTQEFLNIAERVQVERRSQSAGVTHVALLRKVLLVCRRPPRAEVRAERTYTFAEMR